MRAFVIVVACLSAAACAKAPESISAAQVSDVRYQGQSCGQLRSEHARLGASLASVSEEQKLTQRRDAAGVFFIGLPMGSMTGGDKAPEIARLKGEQEGVRRTASRKQCALPAPVGAPAKTS